MVDRVFVHIGLPKTATSYLQTILWSNRDRLRTRGVVVPGAERRDHLWASRTVREERRQGRAPERHRTAWDRIPNHLPASAQITSANLLAFFIYWGMQMGLMFVHPIVLRHLFVFKAFYTTIALIAVLGWSVHTVVLTDAQRAPSSTA